MLVAKDIKIVTKCDGYIDRQFQDGSSGFSAYNAVKLKSTSSASCHCEICEIRKRKDVNHKVREKTRSHSEVTRLTSHRAKGTNSKAELDEEPLDPNNDPIFFNFPEAAEVSPESMAP